jgi:hypothetical protein
MVTVTTSYYSGPDRRRRRVYVTQNREYHCKDGVCLAVRDRGTGEFLKGHRAIGKHVSAAVTLANGGVASIAMPDEARPGERMHFVSGPEDPKDVLTSPLLSVERPPREVVALYDVAS